MCLKLDEAVSPDPAVYKMISLQLLKHCLGQEVKAILKVMSSGCQDP